MDWLGDIGGLNEALVFIVRVLLYPYTVFSQRSFLLQNLFRFQKSNAGDDDDDDSQDTDPKLRREKKVSGISDNESLLGYLRKTFGNV